MAAPNRVNVAEFYEREVLPALTARLDVAFPEFGWRPDPHGWVAGNQEFTHATLGVRADRVVCHGDAPRGFLIHGEGPVLWTTYVNQGHPARGREFVEAVRRLADRADVEAARLDLPPSPRDRRARLLEDAFEACRRELQSHHGAAARAYLANRGFTADRVDDIGLGAFPPRRRLALALIAEGHTESEVLASGLFADNRWPGRICGAWRDERGRVATLWCRAVRDDEPDRYLYLRGASRAALVPYGFSDVLAAPSPAARRDLVLVEGVMDFHHLRARGVANVAALGSTATRPDLFERLVRCGVEKVTFCLDSDLAGTTGTRRAIRNAVRLTAALDLYVATIDPAKDPDELVRERGMNAWNALINHRECALGWETSQLLGDVHPGASPPERRTAASRAFAWLSTLPPYFAIEQADGLRLVAERCGYSVDAVTRSFHARRGADREPSADDSALTARHRAATSNAAPVQDR